MDLQVLFDYPFEDGVGCEGPSGVVMSSMPDGVGQGLGDHACVPEVEPGEGVGQQHRFDPSERGGEGEDAPLATGEPLGGLGDGGPSRSRPALRVGVFRCVG